MTRELRFNVGGDPAGDVPYIQPDTPSGAAPIPLLFEPGATPPNRALALIPETSTGGATVVYQQGAKSFRVILPPLDQQFQAEAGEAPQLPPEYEGNADAVALHYDPPRPRARQGVVTLVGKAWTDAEGPYYPLGDTLLYALGHWHRGGSLRALVEENLDFIASYRHDYVRILAEVDWVGEEIDPSWPDYEQHLAELVDYAYDRYGLRTKITVTGGGTQRRLAGRKVISVISQGRQQKVQLIEAVNEQNASGAEAIAIAQSMRDLGVPVATGRGNAGIDVIKSEGTAARTTVDILHTERSLGDPHEPGGPSARQARQCWDFQHFRRAAEDGEGPGPASSGGQLDDPYVLSARRAANIICGAGASCLHTGSGVFGRDYHSSAGRRFARLRDIPRITEIMRAVRNADAQLPRGIENWHPFNTNHPVKVRAGEINKLYGAITGRDFVEIAIGCAGETTFVAEQPCSLKVINPAEGTIVLDTHLATGETFKTNQWAPVFVGLLD